MASSTRVFNQTRGCYMKRNQALKGVENCAFAWVEFNVSVRVLTCEEAVQARHSQVAQESPDGKKKKTAPPLPWAELPGIVYRPTDANQAIYRREVALMREANRFAALHAPVLNQAQRET